jgi:hypothetical protein
MIKPALVMTLPAAAMLLMSTAAPALAGEQSTKQDAGWGCAADVGLPAGHCISPGTVQRWDKIVDRGLTFQLLVFDADGDFLTAEIATFNASADSRPCPHDTDPRNTDGTYWEFVPGLYVCHHQPA